MTDPNTNIETSADPAAEAAEGGEAPAGQEQAGGESPAASSAAPGEPKPKRVRYRRDDLVKVADDARVWRVLRVNAVNVLWCEVIAGAPYQNRWIDPSVEAVKKARA